MGQISCAKKTISNLNQNNCAPLPRRLEQMKTGAGGQRADVLLPQVGEGRGPSRGGGPGQAASVQLLWGKGGGALLALAPAALAWEQPAGGAVEALLRSEVFVSEVLESFSVRAECEGGGGGRRRGGAREGGRRRVSGSSRWNTLS